MSGHERERLSAYLDDELHLDERTAVEAHLASCPECTAFLAQLVAANEAAAALPAEAPEGYFETLPARVRARLQPRKAAFAVRRVPVWTWAAAAALLLAVITPLTLRQTRPTPEAASSSLPAAAPPAPRKADSNAAARSSAPEAPPKASAPTLSRAGPSPPVVLPPAAQASAVVPPVAAAARPEAKDEAAHGVFSREPAAAPPDEPALARPEALADVESER
ncbi:MAG TPA: zf-HC2 domain-containing protein, partial [Vicinamibacteria bacterium]|nr:zf-HC2 domain-containing protein [Vicinamibacteria bacterium]